MIVEQILDEYVLVEESREGDQDKNIKQYHTNSISVYRMRHYSLENLACI